MIVASHGIIGSSIVQFNAAAFESAFNDRVVAFGGSLTSTERAALVTLINSLNNAGIWTKMKAIYPMVGASDAACKQNLKSSSFTGSFSSGWEFASTGAKPNGTSAFFNTNFLALSNLTRNDHHISFYSRTQDISKNGYNMGVEGNPFTNRSMLTLHFQSVSLKAFINGAFSSGWTSVNNTNTQGFQVGGIHPSTQSKLWFNGSLLATTAPDNNSLNDLNYYIGAMNFQGNAGNFMPHETAFNSIGDGLTDTEAANFYTAVQAFQTTLGREV